MLTKKDGFTFVCINNNNNNFNGSVPEPVPPAQTCEDCFLEALGETGLADLVEFLGTLTPPAATTLDLYCALIQGQILADLPIATIVDNIQSDLAAAGVIVEDSVVTDLVECLIEVFGETTA